MTTLYRVDPDLESVQKALKTIPQFKFDARPLPENPKIGRQYPEEGYLEEYWTELGRYCSVCHSVSRDLGVFAALDDQQDPEKDELYINWHVVLRQLLATAEQGCVFCGFMLCEFFNDPCYTFSTDLNDITTPNSIACCAQNLNGSRSSKLLEAIERTRKLCDELQKDEEPWFMLIAQPIDYDLKTKRYGKIRFQAWRSSLSMDEIMKVLGFRREIVLDIFQTGGASATVLQYQPPEINLADRYSYDYASEWIQECLDEHTECPKAFPVILPTRVIEILSDTEVRLISEEVEDYYAALSYCWGGAQSFCTTQETLESRELGFLREDLPAALQDAIAVAFELGIKYLWIDSICIIQDSDQDKERGLAMMANYYMNAYITICAGGHTCSNKFLVKHGECKDHPGHATAAGLLPLTLLDPQGRTGQAFFGKECPYTWSQESIARRAWTLQEHLLSPRALMYGNRLLWQCNSAQHSAGGIEYWRDDPRSFDYAQARSRLYQYSTRDNGDTLASPEHDEMVQLWYQIVHQYSYRKLSFPHDKFPALSALANQFQAILGDDYIAGLWRRQFLRGLLWSTYPDLNPPRCTPWRAPSWSWASCESVISYDNLPGNDAIEVAEVLKCEVVPKSSLVPFGEVISAELELRAPVLHVPKDGTMKLLKLNNTIPRQEDTATYRSNLWDIMTRDLGNLPGSGTWEVPEDHILLVLLAEPQENIDVEAGAQTQEEVAILSGLVLTPVEGGKYERIARFTNLSLKGYEQIRAGQLMQTIVLL